MFKAIATMELESTCQKRSVVCVLVDKDGIVLSMSANKCNPIGECSRIGLVQTKENYDENSCNWTHAEIGAINELPIGSKPVKAILKGHNFYCDSCENALKKLGVKEFEIMK